MLLAEKLNITDFIRCRSSSVRFEPDGKQSPLVKVSQYS
jgi:hypothetical protein